MAVLLSVLWGANPVVVKLGLLDAPPIRLAWMRFLIGGVVIVLWAWLSGRFQGFRIARSERFPLLGVGVLLAVQSGVVNVGTHLTSAAHVVVILNSYAVHTVVLAHFMIPGDRLTPRRLAGVLIAYAGIFLLFARELAGAGFSLLGDTLTFAGALLLAERTIYLARAVQRLDPVKLLLAQALIGGTILLIVSLAVEPAPTNWTLRLAGSIAYQGVLITGFNFSVNLWLLKYYRPSALAPWLLTQPLFGVIAAALFTGDPLTLDLILASLAVAAGIGLAGR
ncbi:MAG: DMT family transporter [Dehalococcoidia bacterium]|nr:DMT family transporter [Dehalococcoidia bacterium]